MATARMMLIAEGGTGQLQASRMRVNNHIAKMLNRETLTSQPNKGLSRMAGSSGQRCRADWYTPRIIAKSRFQAIV